MFKMSEVCRLCLKSTCGMHNNMIAENFQQQIIAIMPEIDIDLIKSPVICLQCSDLLLSAYTFKINCLETEKQIKSHLKTTIKTVTLDELLNKQKDVLEEVKREAIDLELDMKFHIQKKNEDIVTKTVGELKEAVKKIEEDSLVKKKQCRNKQFACKECGKRFSSLRRWSEHMRLHTTKRFLCEICTEGFDTKHELLTHKSNKHDARVNCIICGKSFLYLTNLQKHMEKHDQNPDTYFECDVCGLKTKQKFKLAEHVRIHTGERPYKCTFCGKAFTQSSTLSTHVKSLHSTERPYVCEICGKSFPVKAYYTTHMISHSTTVEKNHVCSFCGKSYRVESKLQQHLKRHTGEKTIVCEVCSKSFVDMHGLRKHMLVHTGEKPHECHICQKRFSQRYNMVIHQRSCVRRNGESPAVEVNPKIEEILPC